MGNPTEGEQGDGVVGSPQADDAIVTFSPLAPAIPFDASMLEMVRGFDCGPEPWEKEVAAWIQQPAGGGGAIDAMADLATEVWLYRTTTGQLVGFGSLGVHNWRYPNPKKSERITVQIIPFFGIRHEFKGKPPSPTPREERYAHRIFEDLLAKVVERRSKSSILGLLVDKSNTRAVAFYERFGFEIFSDRGTHHAMLVVLDE